MAKKDKELSANEVEALKRVLDEVDVAYRKNNKVIFATESERAKQHFGVVNKALRDWGKAKRCMVPKCTERSISRSHTIPRGMSLSTIAEGGHLTTPFFNQKLGLMQAQAVGAADASTFPGFCEKHERLFDGFESKGAISSEVHVVLQLYRAACREHYRTGFVLAQHDQMMSSYCSIRDQGLQRLVREKAPGFGVPSDFTFGELRLHGDPLVNGFNERVEPVRVLAAHLRESLLPAFEKAVFEGDASGVSIRANSIDLEIPVALSGAGTFCVSDRGKRVEVTILMNVVPGTNETLFAIAANSSNDRYLDAYLSTWMKHALGMLSMIESWMINGTDQWYLKPSVWDALPAERRERLLSELLGCSKNIGEECDLSIFDELRRKIIALSDASNAQCETAEYLTFMSKERNKLG